MHDACALPGIVDLRAPGRSLHGGADVLVLAWPARRCCRSAQLQMKSMACLA